MWMVDSLQTTGMRLINAFSWTGTEGYRLKKSLGETAFLYSRCLLGQVLMDMGKITYRDMILIFIYPKCCFVHRWTGDGLLISIYKGQRLLQYQCLATPAYFCNGCMKGANRNTVSFSHRRKTPAIIIKWQVP